MCDNCGWFDAGSDICGCFDAGTAKRVGVSRRPDVGGKDEDEEVRWDQLG